MLVSGGLFHSHASERRVISQSWSERRVINFTIVIVRRRHVSDSFDSEKKVTYESW